MECVVSTHVLRSSKASRPSAQLVDRFLPRSDSALLSVLVTLSFSEFIKSWALAFARLLGMLSWKLALSLGTLVQVLGTAKGSVTVYYQQGQNPFQTTTAAAAQYTGAAAYNPTVLNPPAPLPDLHRNFPIQLVNGGQQGASILQTGQFFGFSIEMSVVNQVREYRTLWST